MQPQLLGTAPSIQDQFTWEWETEREISNYICWKILEGLVPNFPGSSEITPRYSDRRGRSCFKRSLDSSFQHLRSNSLSVHGIQLFNALPRIVRDLHSCTKEKFKSTLDSFLKDIPDEPQIPGYTVKYHYWWHLFFRVRISKNKDHCIGIAIFVLVHIVE